MTAAASSPIRLAIVGCGAITENFHLPVLAGHAGYRIVALIDPATDRAARLARAYGVPVTLADDARLRPEDVDAILLATPPYLHAQGAIGWMERGAHVLVEKPMALTAADAEEMVAVAERTRRVLTVGVYRRLLPAIRLLRAALDSRALGRLRSVDLELGSAYTWPLASLGGMRKEQSGGGMLMDMGTHVLDLLHELVPSVVRLDRYRDNALGGVETDCLADLTLDTPEGPVPVRLELSRSRTLRSTFQFVCEHGTHEWSFGERDKVAVVPPVAFRDPLFARVRDVAVEARWSDEPVALGYEGFRAQFDDFFRAVRGLGPSALSGASMLPTVRLIEQCYATAEALEEPWVTLALPNAPSGTRRTSPASGASRAAAPQGRVLITGAGGFVGTRLGERLLLGSSWDIRAMVRTPGGISRLARLPVDVTLGDVLDRTSLTRALHGCDAVVHAAVGTSWREADRIAVNVEGTRNIVEAALAAGVRRFVHVGSISVYGDDVTGSVDERTPVNPRKGWDYGESKAQAERIVLDAVKRGLQAVVLRVAVIYGPFGPTIVVRPIEHLLKGALVLVECRDVPSNTVFVDNVAEAIRLALEAPAERVVGSVLNVSDEDGFTWGEYFGYFAEAVGATVRHVSKADWYAAHPPPVSKGALASLYEGTRSLIGSRETKALINRVIKSPWGTPLRRVFEKYPNAEDRLKALVRPETPLIYTPAPAVPPVEPFVVDPIHARIATALARERLGDFQVVDRATAMATTLEWLRAARVVPAHPTPASRLPLVT